MTYTSLIFVCITLYAKRLSRPLSQRFLMTYTSLIFVCVTLYAKQLSRSLSQRFLMVYSRFIFVCVILYAKRLSRPLNQRFLMTYSRLIFVCVGCLACAHDQVDPSTNVLQRYIHGLSLYDFCMHKLRQVPPLQLSRLLARWHVKMRNWHAFGTLTRGHAWHEWHAIQQTHWLLVINYLLLRLQTH